MTIVIEDVKTVNGASGSVSLSPTFAGINTMCVYGISGSYPGFGYPGRIPQLDGVNMTGVHSNEHFYDIVGFWYMLNMPNGAHTITSGHSGSAFAMALSGVDPINSIVENPYGYTVNVSRHLYMYFTIADVNGLLLASGYTEDYECSIYPFTAITSSGSSMLSKKDSGIVVNNMVDIAAPAGVRPISGCAISLKPARPMGSGVYY